MLKNRPDIIFIVLDTHRVDRLSGFGYDIATSPNLDQFAQSANRYLNAVAPGQWTIPSHSSMFTGVYPTTHQTVQASDRLPNSLSTLAELLRSDGYTTIGLCNNPLVGLLNNGLQRGFEQFYNFGGAAPSLPSHETQAALSSLAKARSIFQETIRRIADPIQHSIASSDKVFHLILNPLLVPLWSRYANFKGNTSLSIQETAAYLGRKASSPETRPPIFLFLNLMETHLPYSPHRKFTREYAPIYHDEPQARDFMKAYNTQALRWLLPMEEPFPKLESETLSSMYNAEVAYQDHLLEPLLERLNTPPYDEAMVIIVSDHGEMLGEHQIMGHGLGLYQDLIHVPLMVRFPGQTGGQVISDPVSTVRLFHTVLNAAGISPIQPGVPEDISNFDNYYTPLNHKADRSPSPVVSESYPPTNVLKIMEKITPNLLETFHSEATNWAFFQQNHKLLRVDGVGDQLFDLAEDPFELSALSPNGKTAALGAHLNQFLTHAISIRPTPGKNGGQVFTDDEKLIERLRGLGYLE